MVEGETEDTYIRLFKGLLDEITESAEEVMLAGARKLLDDPGVEKYIADKKVQPYVYLSGLLNLLGRDINADNMRKVLKGINIEPDDSAIDTLLKADYENGVIYIYAIYFLEILGKEHSMKNVTDLVGALGILPNETFAQNALDRYNRRYGEKP